ncbi:hypothetical protein C8A03DRAFT_35690 [Achaetomium macrosporum]|uniref:Ankyrin repeat protein n=1 Tax=Achaetomium macrosporum TaxID=79813 RepID=A0AAN7C6R7_9PEZI|nr:hypothetical protein C8A03DRAFT_35690 [Achaetomium macrosporum]
MPIAQQESHKIAVYAAQGQTVELATIVRDLAMREGVSPAQILIGCKDDFQQTAAHAAAKTGQTRSIEALAELLGSMENKSTYFNLENRFSGDRPVHTAMRHGFLATFKALVANGADPTAKNRFGDSVMDFLGDFKPDEVRSIVDQYRRDSADGKR